MLALKISVGDTTAASSEIAKMKLYEERLGQAGATVFLTSSIVRRGQKFAALLTSPVGRDLKPLKKDISAALTSLRDLHVAGFSHGDARWKNAIILPDGKCRWIDLRSLEDTADESQEYKETEFHNDVTTFVESFGLTANLPASLTSSYLQGGNATELLKAISSTSASAEP